MSINLCKLPYDHAALEPHISAETLSYHYDKHHRGYVDKLNTLISRTPYEALSLAEIVSKARNEAKLDIFNNAAQAWNHAFLWESMSPSGETRPGGQIKDLIESEFGDLDGFKERFKKAATSQFGSGWAWLVQDGSNVKILTTSNAESPVGTHLQPLLTLDVWEHAYYLDYQNERGKYIDAFLNKLINWKFASANMIAAKSTKAA